LSLVSKDQRLSAKDQYINNTNKLSMILLQKENKVDQVIPDERGLRNSIKVHHNGTVNALKVGVNIKHPYIGDLKVRLIAPSGESVLLHDQTGGSGDNLIHVYGGTDTSPLNGSATKGYWTLECEDFAPKDEGSLISWNLEMRCTLAEERSEIIIPDGEDVWLLSEQESNQAGIIEEGTAKVVIQHPYQGDLVVKIKSPDGTEIMLHNREGGSTNNIEKTYNLDAFKGKNTLGIWTLMVRDGAPRDNGVLKYWKLGFKYQNIHDLTKIASVSPAISDTLNSNGVYSYGRLSTLGTAKLRNLLAEVEAVEDVNVILEEAKGQLA